MKYKTPDFVVCPWSVSCQLPHSSTMSLLRLAAAASARSRGPCPSLATLSWQNMPCRPFASSSTDQKSAHKNEDDEAASQLGELLYSRAPSRAMVPRGLLALTTVHTSYWLWYVLDFTPSLNAAALKKNEVLAATAAASDGAVEAFAGIDPTVGYLGLGMAIMMSLGSAAFPKYLVSEIRKADNGALRVGVHSLPFCTPQTGTQAEVYPPAGVTIDSTHDASAIFTRNNGDLTKSRGFLALRAEGKKVNLLLNINSEDTMNKPDELLDCILPSEMKTARGANISTTSGRKKRRKSLDPRKKQQREQRQLRRRQ